MNKYKHITLGILIGFALSLSVGAYAEGVTTTLKNIIGSVVAGSFPVTINGTKIDDPAAVISIGTDDKGYLPIRAVGDALGIEITFDPDLGIFINGTVTGSTYAKQGIQAQINTLNEQRELVLKKINQILKDEDDQYEVIKQYENVTIIDGKRGIKEKDEIYFTAKKKWDDYQAEKQSLSQQSKSIANQALDLQK